MKYEIIKTYISRPPKFSGLVPALVTLLACTLASNLFWTDVRFSENLAASRDLGINQHQFWRFFTATFVHSDMQHLLSNSYMLGILSFFVAGYFGKTAYPLMGLLGATLTNFFSILTYKPYVRLMGASGLVYFLAGFWLMMFVLIERQRTWSKRLLRVIGVGLVILFPTSFEPTTSYRAHAIGFALGLGFALIYFKQNKKRIRKAEVKRPIIEDDDFNEVED